MSRLRQQSERKQMVDEFGIARRTPSNKNRFKNLVARWSKARCLISKNMRMWNSPAEH